MNHARPGLPATRKEYRLSFCIAALLWVLSFAALFALVAWSARDTV